MCSIRTSRCVGWTKRSCREVLDRDYKKSKLTTASFGIPLELTYMPVYKLCLSAQVYGDVVFNSHTKYKKPITKDRFSGSMYSRLASALRLPTKGWDSMPNMA